MRIGVDLGGSKIELALLADNGDVNYQSRIATPQQDYQATIHTIVDLVLKAELQAGQVCSVGLGTPGSQSSVTGLMKNCNSTCLNQQALQQDLEIALKRPIRLANDANCFALSEALDGAAQHADVVFAVILGTGVGGGLVVSERLLSGRNSIAGEWGHNPLSAQVIPEVMRGRSCYCGRLDCVESHLSGPGLSESYYQLFNQSQGAVAIAEQALTGDENASTVLALYYRQLASALAQVINVVDPDVIVLGGGVSNITALYQRIPELWGEFVFNDSIKTQLLAAQYGDASGVRGAARLW